ncbi:MULTISPECIES: hydantoinase/oxoprolinase family protein [unclassified Streptomyces]|uniref:hydantoinase/oxoprolinase family protein n=1 Tax=unclassified Streptomyces TaxID=2593676 RepID=UPI002DD9EA3A|nr:hydantoinase/oxoprolinase family protein [Streptomyces sp. NBC_01795]WSA96843.1 hydantoinase/oxoprolinase family protein [Streptomyces sp. NBC_01795]WSS39227.1 hydantoinase/oxoprolinase family protein [Streptomyces sp. NBC_01187]
MLRIGIDVGGTFTDVTALDAATGRFHIHKLPSTTDDQSVAVAEGVRAVLRQAGADPGEVGYLGHGTTVATNTVLESKGALTALVTTAGLRDILEIGRQQRPDLYDMDADKAPSLVPRSLVHAVIERMSAEGKVLTPLDEDDTAAAVARVREAEPEAVAVCFLHSYRNGDHELEVADRLRAALPEAYVCASAEVAPVFREFERFSTTVVNAYVGPKINRYMSRLAERIRATGIPVEPRVIGSSGGMMSLDSVSRHPVTTLLSGPSAGVVAASHVAGQAGFGNLITFDMGGTSTDVCLVRDGRALVSSQRRISHRPVRTPSLDIHTVGAGGGSIARVDPGGALEVGPGSAGSQPGPAAYGRGGVEPTVTDANVLRGRLNPEYILGGALAVDYAAAERAVDSVAQAMGAQRPVAARGIGRIAAVNMAGAVRKVSVEAGEDPRGYVLVAFGGAGPLHAVEVAREVGMSTVLVPPNPGTLCALGLLVTDIRTEFAKAVLEEADERNPDKLNEVLHEVHESARGWLASEAPPGAATEITGEARMRYARQNFELSVPLPQRVIGAARFDSEAVAEIVAAFHEQHAKSYGFAHRDALVQIVEVQLTAAAAVDKPELPAIAEGSEPGEALIGRRRADFDETGPVDTPVYDRAGLRAGTVLPGPAIVEQLDTTTVITPDATAHVDRYGNLIIEVEQR